MTTPYEQALEFIKRHPGCGSSRGLSKLILSLFDSNLAFGFRECIAELDSRNLSLAQDIVHRFVTEGETHELRHVGREIIALNRTLYDLGLVRYAAKLDGQRTMKYAPIAAEKVLRKMFAKLAEAGWHPVKVWDGEESVKVETVEEAIDVIDSVELSNVIVERDGQRHTIALIPCNGEDVISDHTFKDNDDSDGFSALMNSVDEEV